ncbi:MAG: protein kinase [Clostridiales bacterium]|jgi:TPR repeat protein|nr:protein kinase [Clostridiales bacterium]
MELLQSLEKVSIGRAFGEDETVKIGIDICRALELLAKSGTIHRDVKPENIFLSKHGDFKLGDFGIARQIERTLTAGIPNYTAPEVYTGKQYDATADLYSLGLVMHRMLNNKKMPFISADSTTLSQTERDTALGKRMRGEKIPPPALASPELSSVILKACDSNVENRYKTASEMRMALETYKNPVLAEQSSASAIADPEETTSTGVDKPEYRIKPKHSHKDMCVMKVAAAVVAVIIWAIAFSLVPQIRVNGYIRAARRGNVEAQITLGNFYYSGINFEKDYSEAAKWYRKAAEQGNADAQNIIGARYYFGEGVDQDYAEAVKWYRRAAEKGDAAGQDNLGNRYYFGEGVERDFAEAVKWYKEAANRAYAPAQYNLGNRYLNGEGVELDYYRAEKWYRMAAEQGYAPGQNQLGLCYYNGYGIARNYSKAVKWFKKSAKQGDAIGQYGLGYCYYHGNGVEKDYEKAVKWYRKSAEQGNVDAQTSLGFCYLNGDGVEENFEEATKWFEKSGGQGEAKGCFYYDQ